MLVWPDGDRPHALQGLCPHEGVGFQSGIFNGRVIICTAHGWEFDARNGRSLSPTGWTLEEYPLRIDGDWIEVDMEMVIEPNTESGPAS